MWKSVVAPAVVVSILWITVSLFTSYSLNLLIESNAQTISEDVSTIESAWAMRRDSWRLETALLDALQSHSPHSLADIQTLEERFQNSLDAARRTSLTAPEVALVETIKTRFADYSGQIHDILKAHQADPGHAAVFDRQKLSQLATALTDACRELSDVNDRLISERAAQSKRVYSFVYTLRQYSLVLGPGLGLLVGILVARRMTRSVSQISASLHWADHALARDHAPPNPDSSEALPALHRQADLVADRVGKAVAELEKRQQRIVQSERLASVGELAAGVAHEIRNPLTSVKLLIQNAARHPSGPSLSKQQSEIILQEILRMESLIQDLLDFARPPQLRIARHNVIPTLRRTINLVAARAQQHQVTIQEEFAESEILLNGDVEQLLLVFVNLAINGIEAMKGGSLQFIATTSGQTCKIIFLDEGPGIPEDLLARLFEPFVTTKERGTGLGLAISRRIVEEHGGWLTARNQPAGRGAEIIVELPLAAESPADIHPTLTSDLKVSRQRAAPAALPSA